MRDAKPSDRKTYTIVLTLVALGILIAGVALRPQSKASPVRPDSEFLQLQLLAQRRDLERRSLFFQTKARAFYVRSQAARAQPAQFTYSRPRAGDTILLVATDSSGQPVWANAMTAGFSQTTCRERTIEEIETTITIPRTLANAAAFDLEETLAGFVISCGDRRILTTLEGFTLASQPTLSEQLEACCGLKVAADPANKGVEIVQLAEDSPLAAAGAKVADRILEIDDRPLESVDQLEALTKGSDIVLSVQRGRSPRLLKLTLPAVDSQAVRSNP